VSQPEQTRVVITWMDDDGFLKLTGRVPSVPAIGEKVKFTTLRRVGTEVTPPMTVVDVVHEIYVEPDKSSALEWVDTQQITVKLRGPKVRKVREEGR
jgi:hypothetical protein